MSILEAGSTFRRKAGHVNSEDRQYMSIHKSRKAGHVYIEDRQSMFYSRGKQSMSP